MRSGNRSEEGRSNGMPEIHTEKAIDSPRVIAEMSGLNSEADEGCDCLDVRGERRIGQGPELVAAPSRSFSFIPMRLHSFQ